MQKPLILFDCDGVLVDSEIISIGLLHEIVNQAGINMSIADTYKTFLGKPISNFVNLVKEATQQSVAPVDVDEFHKTLFKIYEKNLQAVPNITAAIESLDNPKCVASSSTPHRIAVSLELTGLSQYFSSDTLFSASMVARGKPHPDLFLYAAKQLNTDSNDCIVIEDSPAGVTAAKAADMKVIAFTGGSHGIPGNLKARLEPLKPDLIIDNMNDLAEAINTLS